MRWVILGLLALVGCSSSTEPGTPPSVSLTFWATRWDEPDEFALSQDDGWLVLEGSYRVPQGGAILKASLVGSGPRQHGILVKEVPEGAGTTIHYHLKYKAWIGPVDPGDHGVSVTHCYSWMDSTAVVFADTVTVK